MKQAKLPHKKVLFICGGKKCSEKQNPEAAKAFFKGKIKADGLEKQARACVCSCLNLCEQAPTLLAGAEASSETYHEVAEGDWDGIYQNVFGELKK